MITIEVLQSNIPESIGLYEYQFESIYVGRSKKADLIFNDSALPSKFLTIKIKKNNLVVFNEPDTPFYFVNSKKMSGQRKLQIGDLIQFGEHVIKIISFNANEVKREDENLHELYANFQKEVPEQQFLLRFFEEEIINLENPSKE